MMTPTLPAVLVTLALLAVSISRAESSDSSDLLQVSNLHPVLEEAEDAVGSRFRTAIDDARLMSLNGGLTALRDSWLAHASQLSGHVDRRYEPTGFLGSRGKRLIPGLGPFSLTRYDQGNRLCQHGLLVFSPV